MSRNSVMKLQVSLKSDKNNGYLTGRPANIFSSYLAQSFLAWEILQANLYLSFRASKVYNI